MDTWEKQPSETVHAYHAFCHYRDIGITRSRDRAFQEHRVLCQHHESSTETAPGGWTAWQTKYQWYARAISYDEEQERISRYKNEQDIREAKVRHVGLARLALNSVVSRLQAIDPSEIPVASLASLLKTAADLELRSLGEPSDIRRTEVTGAGGGAVETIGAGFLEEMFKHDDTRKALDLLAQRMESDSSGDSGEMVEGGLE